MAGAFVQAISAGETSSSSSITTGSYTLTAGNRVILCVGNYGNTDTSTTVTDSGTSSTWTKIGLALVEENAVAWVLWECKSIASTASSAITVNFSSSNGGRLIAGIEFSGLDTNNVQDSSGIFRGAGTSTNSTDGIAGDTMTPTAQPAMVFGCVVCSGDNNNVLVAGTDFTGTNLGVLTFNGGSRTWVEYKRITSTADLAVTFTDTVYGSTKPRVITGAIIGEQAASTTTTKGRRLLLGVG